jgi:hypothetical protein
MHSGAKKEKKEKERKEKVKLRKKCRNTPFFPLVRNKSERLISNF